MLVWLRYPNPAGGPDAARSNCVLGMVGMEDMDLRRSLGLRTACGCLAVVVTLLAVELYGDGDRRRLCL